MPKASPIADRLWAKVDKSAGPDGCWPWTGYVMPNGYATIKADRSRRQLLVHRVAFILANGPIPDDQQVDHECHNRDPLCPGGYACLHRRCTNDAHLAAVTSTENNLRACRRVACCKNGHERTPENTAVGPAGRLRCLICLAEQNQRRYEHNRQITVEKRTKEALERAARGDACPLHDGSAVPIVGTIKGEPPCPDCQSAYRRGWRARRR